MIVYNCMFFLPSPPVCSFSSWGSCQVSPKNPLPQPTWSGHGGARSKPSRELKHEALFLSLFLFLNYFYFYVNPLENILIRVSCLSPPSSQLFFRTSATILKLLEEESGKEESEPKDHLDYELFFNMLAEAAVGPFARGEEKSMPKTSDKYVSNSFQPYLCWCQSMYEIFF